MALFDAALSIEVTDGPPLQNIPAEGLYVGATDVSDSIDFQQDWAGQGGLRRNETFKIPHLLFVRTGDNAVSTHRAAIFGYLASIEDALRADPTLGISGYVVRAGFGTSGDYSQTQSADGLVLRIYFTITVETRI